MACHEAGAAGDVERSLRRQARDPRLELLALLVPSGPVLVGVEVATHPPVVVLAGARVVVRLHCALGYARCCRSRRCRISPKAATPGRSTRSGGRCRIMRACSTSTPTPITTGPCSRSSAL